MAGYPKRFHTRRIGLPIYGALAKAVIATSKEAGIQPIPIADVGSSIGVFLSEIGKALKADRGMLVGVDYGEAVSENYISEGSTLFPHNLQSEEIPKIANGPFSVMTSWETAEHVHERYADKIVRMFSENLAPGGLLVFGAATPGQRGKHHVNCRPPTYWHDKFRKVGVIRNDRLTGIYRKELRLAFRRPGVYFYNTYCLLKT